MSTPRPEPIAPVVLEAGPLRLRPWREDDVWAALQDPAVRLWSGSARSREDTAELVRRRGDWSAGDHASWAVVDGSCALLASVSLHSIDRGQGDAPVLCRSTASSCATRWRNTASGRVAEKAGFTVEGRCRRSFRYGDGVKHDELLWSRLADDPVPDRP